MTEPDRPPLPAAVRAAARESLPGLFEGALEDARSEVRSLLREAFVRALLDEAGLGEHGNQPPWHASAPSSDGVGHGLYLYGFTAGDAASVSGLRGVEASMTFAITAGELVAIVSDVAASQGRWGLDDEGAMDLALLAPRLAEHQRVLETVLEDRTVLPMRFGTSYRSGDAVSETLERHADSIRTELNRLDGKVEWGLTVTWQPAPPSHRGGEGAQKEPAGGPAIPSTGRNYLARRGSELLEAERVTELRSHLGAALHAAVGAVAVAGLTHPAIRSRGGGSGASTLLRSSYLVERSERSRFESVIVDQLQAGAAYALNAELTGPWPPYHFARPVLEGVVA